MESISSMMASGEFLPLSTYLFWSAHCVPTPPTPITCKACKTRNLKSSQGFWKELWPPCAKDASDNQRHLEADTVNSEFPGCQPEPHWEAFPLPCLRSLQSRLSAQGLGSRGGGCWWPRPHRAVQKAGSSRRTRNTGQVCLGPGTLSGKAALALLAAVSIQR